MSHARTTVFKAFLETLSSVKSPDFQGVRRHQAVLDGGKGGVKKTWVGRRKYSGKREGISI